MRLSREVGDLYSLEVMLINLGFAAFVAGDLDGARPQFTQALRIAHQIDDRVAQFYALDALGCHAAASGQPRLAARLLGAAETLRSGAGANVNIALAPRLAQAESSAITALEPAKFDAELEAGKGLSRVAAVALALGESAAAPGAASDDAT